MPPEAETCEDDEFEGILMSCDNLRYFVVSRDGERFPTSGYLNGSVLNVRTAIQMSSVPRELIDEGYRAAVEGIDQIVNLLTTQTNSRTLDRISSLLRQHHGPFTWKMAAIVLLNAQTFHEELAKSRHDVVTAETMRVGGIITQEQILAAWRRVLDIDYAPIFETAAEILASIPAQTAGDIIRVITKTTSRILATKAHKFGDFYGMLYQKQLYHRKHVAAFYTKPPAAVLLVNLTMRGCEDDAWRDLDAIRNMRVADFACGSGSLLTAAYTHMIHCSRASLAVIHADIMQNCLWGADIFPIATHFAVSSLSSLFSSEAFDDCHIYTRLLKADTAGFHLGSLDLIEQTAQFVVVGERHGGHGVRSVQEATLQDRSCDYIVMNPPFARATNHGGDRPDPVPPFALPGNSPDTQRAMGRHNSRLFVGTCAHGHAGLASYFMAICNKKLRGGGGRLGLILPSTVMSGESWTKVRNLINEWYDDVTIVTVGHVGSGTYSSETSMHEIILVAQKREAPRSSRTAPLRIKFVQLDSLPLSRFKALEVAKAVKRVAAPRLEDDAGCATVLVGGDSMGRMIDCPVENGRWMCRRVSDISHLLFAYNLSHSLPLPPDDTGQFGTTRTIPVVSLGKIADLGRHHLDIIGTKHDGTPQGPFKKTPYSDRSRFPCLWGNNALTQTQILVEPDTSLEKKSNATMPHVSTVWATSTRLHLNYQIGYGAQRLIAAYTAGPTLGGRSWPNVVCLDSKFEKTLSLWCNSTFGLVLYWQTAGDQQRGRGMMSLGLFRKAFPVLDVRTLTDAQIARFNTLFDETCNISLMPFNQVHADLVRQTIDTCISSILGIRTDLNSVYKWLATDPQFSARPAVNAKVAESATEAGGDPGGRPPEDT